MSAVHIAIAWMALEKEVRTHIVCFLSGSHRQFLRKQGKRTCAFAKVQRRDPQMVLLKLMTVPKGKWYCMP